MRAASSSVSKDPRYTCRPELLIAACHLHKGRDRDLSKALVSSYKNDMLTLTQGKGPNIMLTKIRQDLAS